MNYLSPPTRSWARLTLAASLVGLLLPGCQPSAETPEVVGKRVSTTMCERYTRRNELEYARDAQLATEIKAGKITTKVQAMARYNELSAPFSKLSDPNQQATINDSLIASLNEAFPVAEDRLAVGRVVERYMEQCEANLTAWKKTLAPTHLRPLRRQLSGTIPAETYDPTSGMPPPPPPPPPLPDPIND